MNTVYKLSVVALGKDWWQCYIHTNNIYNVYMIEIQDLGVQERCPPKEDH